MSVTRPTTLAPDPAHVTPEVKLNRAMLTATAVIFFQVFNAMPSMARRERPWGPAKPRWIVVGSELEVKVGVVGILRVIGVFGFWSARAPGSCASEGSPAPPRRPHPNLATTQVLFTQQVADTEGRPEKPRKKTGGGACAAFRFCYDSPRFGRQGSQPAPRWNALTTPGRCSGWSFVGRCSLKTRQNVPALRRSSLQA